MLVYMTFIIIILLYIIYIRLRLAHLFFKVNCTQLCWNSKDVKELISYHISFLFYYLYCSLKL